MHFASNTLFQNLTVVPVHDILFKGSQMAKNPWMETAQNVESSALNRGLYFELLSGQSSAFLN